MRKAVASLAVLVLLASSSPAYGFFDLNLGFSVNIEGLRETARAIDRLTTLVDDLVPADPNKGRLRGLLRDAKKDVEDLIDKATTSLRATGQDITKDLVKNYMETHRMVMKDFNDLLKKSFTDARQLLVEFQGVGASIPAHLNHVLKERLEELDWKATDFALGIQSAVPLLGGDSVPAKYLGTKITNRVGFQDIKFLVKNPGTLILKIGDKEIKPREVIGNNVTFRLELDADLRRKFDDRDERLLGFQLVEPALVGKFKARYSGFLLLHGRFPLCYEFKEFPAAGPRDGLGRTLDTGTGMDTLLEEGASTTPLATAARHGELYRVARSRLAAGDYTVLVSTGAAWELKIDFPNGEKATLTPRTPRITNDSFGDVSVAGPIPRGGGVAALQLTVKPNK